MKLIAHDCFERGEDFITRTMTGEELGIGIGFHQSLCNFSEFLLTLMVIKQMETTNNSLYRIGANRKDILQATMGTTRKEQAIRV